jgi:DNA-binding MarR family transcriptional regulator
MKCSYNERLNPMDDNSIRTLKLLNELTKNGHLSQRALSKRLGNALGLTNLYLKHLAKKGYVRVKNIKKNRLIYELTPAGIAKKASLTLGYIQSSFQYYREVRQKTLAIFQSLQGKGCKTVVFYGVGELAEIAYLSLQDAGLTLIGIVDDSQVGREFLGYRVMQSAFLQGVRFDKVILTRIGSDDKILAHLTQHGIQKEKICFLNLD